MTDGIAFAFFDCRSRDLKDISDTVEDARTMTGKLSDVRISTRVCEDSLGVLLEIGAELLDYAKQEKFQYVTKLAVPNQPGIEVADELGGTMNQVYNTHLYKEGENFRAAIIYRDETGSLQEYF